MISEIRIGETISSDGSQVTVRGAKTGELVTAQAHGKYYESTSRNNTYGGAIIGQVTTVGLATTYTGLVLSNPIGSPYNLSLNSCGYAFTVAFPAAAVIGLMTGYHASTNVVHTAAVTPRSQKFIGNSGGSYGLLDSSATLPVAPTVNMIFGAGLTGAITTTPSISSNIIDIDGGLILPPGAFCAFYTSTVSGAAAGAFSFVWEEILI